MERHFTSILKTPEQWSQLCSLLDQRWIDLENELKLNQRYSSNKNTQESVSRRFLEEWKRDKEASLEKLLIALIKIQHDEAVSLLQNWIVEPDNTQNSTEENTQGSNAIPGYQEYEEYWNLFFEFRDEEALEVLQKSVHLNYPPTILRLAYCLKFELHGYKDEEQSAILMKQATQHKNWFDQQALSGKAEDQFNLAFFYDESLNQDKEMTYQWYLKAAKQGYPRAQCYLARFLRSQYKNAEATRWLLQAAHQVESPVMRIDLSGFLKWCTNKEKNMIIEWWKKAAEKNSIAMYHLGQFYLDGTGVKKDKKLGMEYLEQAARVGPPINKTRLALQFRATKQKRMYWLRLAAEEGCKHAQFDLGCAYEDGVGVPQDLNEAMKWFYKSAEKRQEKAQYVLACCLLEQQNDSQALYWLKKAANGGDKDAKHYLMVNKVLVKKYNAWQGARYLWIGHMKEDATYCLLATLPKEIIKEIASNVYKSL